MFFSRGDCFPLDVLSSYQCRACTWLAVYALQDWANLLERLLQHHYVFIRTSLCSINLTSGCALSFSDEDVILIKYFQYFVIDITGEEDICMCVGVCGCKKAQEFDCIKQDLYLQQLSDTKRAKTSDLKSVTDKSDANSSKKKTQFSDN